MPLRRATAVLVVAAGIAGAACSDSGSGSPPPPTDTLFVTTTVARADDGVLRIGVLRPAEGNPATIGESIETAVDLAISQINGAGGVNGRPVRTVVVEEGTTAAASLANIDQLLDDGVDAIVGPASNSVALAGLARIVDAGVVACSPTTASIALDAFPDNGLFVRTMPSDTLQAAAIAEAVEGTGARSVALSFLNDVYGRPFAEAVRVALARRGISVQTSVPFTGDETSITGAAEVIAGLGSPVVVVLADATGGPSLVEAVDALVAQPTQYVVNDTFRRPTLSSPLSRRLTGRIIGVAPAALAPQTFLDQLRASDPQATGFYATNAYDCVNLIALAAASAGSSQPRDIAASIVSASVSGSVCESFPSCSEALATGRNIDYNGPSGALDLAANGDPQRAVFEQFQLDEAGHDTVTRRVTVSNLVTLPEL